MEVTRTEVNAVGNLAALDAAYRSGARFKTWVTFGDSKVRPSHKAVNGTRIPIDEAFTVGNSKLMFPNDTSLGADAEEIVNCRCTLKFDDGKVLTNAGERGIIKENNPPQRNIPISDCIKKIRTDKQKQHILGTYEWTKACREAIAKGGNPKSAFYVSVNIQDIVNKYSGTGRITYNSSSEYPHEFVNLDSEIGITYDKKVGKYVPTSLVEIVYSKKGTHVFPVLPRKDDTNAKN